MKRLLTLGFLLLPVSAFAWSTVDGSKTMTVGSGQFVNISTTTSQPTKLMDYDSFVTRTWITNFSTFTLLISTSSTNLTSNSFGIPPSGTAGFPGTPFSPDGPMSPYQGPIYGVLLGSSTTSFGANNVGVMRTK